MTEIPNAFGGFAPFPNTIMIPTMGLQSDVIGFRFGFGYEKGKRTLRAMSNEEFNNLDEEAEQAIYKRHDSSAIHFFEMEIQNWTNLQKIIIEKSVEIETMKANRTPSALREIFTGFTDGLAQQESGGIIPIKELTEWFWNTFLGGSITVPAAGTPSPAPPSGPAPPAPPSGKPPDGQPPSPPPIEVPKSGFPMLSFFNGNESHFGKWQTMVTVAKNARRANLILRGNPSIGSRRRAQQSLTLNMREYAGLTSFLVGRYGNRIRPHVNYWNNEITKP